MTLKTDARGRKDTFSVPDRPTQPLRSNFFTGAALVHHLLHGVFHFNHHADLNAVGTNSDERMLTSDCLSQVLIYNTERNISAQYTFFTLGVHPVRN